MRIKEKTYGVWPVQEKGWFSASDPMQRPIIHYGLLGGILLLGAALRFWHLDAKPLWLDEVITALFSFGRTYRDVPLDVAFPAARLDELFVYQPGLSCGQIALRVATDSVHPPLFFCLMYRWLGWLLAYTDNWVWILRSLPATLGIATIAAMYGLNRIAFSPLAGLVGAGLMAVSPFVVYLSQEARHYTLPMLLVTLALTVMAQIQREISWGRSRPVWWVAWVVLNLIGLYSHYFVLLALIAQVSALGLWLLRQRSAHAPSHWVGLGVSMGAIALGYVPWLAIMLTHFTRPETAWLRSSDPNWLDYLAPLYQFVVNWALMLVFLPVESQPLAIAIPSAAIMLGITGWITLLLVQGVRRLGRSTAQPALVLLGGFILVVLIQFVGIIYGLGKDITIVPRYNFVWYPGICAVLGASLTAVGGPDGYFMRHPKLRRGLQRLAQIRPKQAIALILLVGCLSSGFVVSNLAFQKPFHPARIARSLYFEPERSLLMVMGYRSMQEVALGLSFALELRKLYPPDLADPPVRFSLVDNRSRIRDYWQRISRLPQPLPLPLNLWVFASTDVKLRNFPDQLRATRERPTQPPQQTVCESDRTQAHRIGFPYLLYRCD